MQLLLMIHDGTSADAAQIENTLQVSLHLRESHETCGLAHKAVGSIQLTDITNANTDDYSCSESSSDEGEDAIGLTVAADNPAAYAGLCVNQSIIRSLLNKPCHPPESFTFPTSTNGRHCSRKCFFPNSTKSNNSTTKMAFIQHIS